jgi:hypothetical protein
VRRREGFVPDDSIKVVTLSPIEDSNERVMKENESIPSFKIATVGTPVSGPFNVNLDCVGVFGDFNSVPLSINPIVVSPSPLIINTFGCDEELK